MIGPDACAQWRMWRTLLGGPTLPGLASVKTWLQVSCGSIPMDVADEDDELVDDDESDAAEGEEEGEGSGSDNDGVDDE